jgi:hypothetical protein
MDLLLDWIAFPLLLTLVSGGLGLLVERSAGISLRGALVVPIGLAALMAVAGLTTYWGATAPLTTPLVVVLALLGLVLGRAHARARELDVATIVPAIAVFAVFAAPVVLSGEATFAGYTVLGDSAIQMILIDRLLEHGHSLAGLPPSSYQQVLQSYFDSGYPTGSQAGLGAMRPLVGQDVAWVYQPYLAFLVANLALSLLALTRDLLRERWIRALVVFLAAQPALVFAYALQGSIKELATAWVAVLLVALLPPLLEERVRARAVVPLAVASAAGVAAIGPAVLPWLGPVLLVAFVGRVRARSSARDLAAQVCLYAVVAIVLSIPALALLGSYSNVTQGVITAGNELGNLLAPLKALQILGIWLSGDYRLAPSGAVAGIDELTLTWVLIGVALASAAIGSAWAIGRKAWMPLLYVAISLIAYLYVARIGSPWAIGKALAIASPAVLLAALLGPVALARSEALPTQVAGGVLALVIAGGVLGSNALAYLHVSLAPADRLEELAAIGDTHAGRGPTLYTEFEEFGKHFLHAADPTGVGEGFVPDLAAAARPGGPGVGFGKPTDLDALDLPYVERFRTIVLRRSPLASRPPANYRLHSSGRWYDVWERTSAGPRVLAHLALGGSLSAGGTTRCTDVAALARQARAVGGALAYAPRPRIALFSPLRGSRRPPAWAVDGSTPATLDMDGQGEVLGTLSVPVTGRYELWLGGSFDRAIDVELDDRLVARTPGALSGRGQFASLDRSLALTSGSHTVRIFRPGRSLAPGAAGGASRLLGPLVLTRADGAAPLVRLLAARDWRKLCGVSADWVEVVRS